VILPSAWLYLRELGATSKLWLSASISAFSVANFLFSPIYGRFADRFSTKTILIISNVFEMLGNLLYLFANDPYSNVEARFIAGLGAAAGAAIFAYVGRAATSPLELNRNMGWIMTARAIGLIVGPAFNFLLVRIDVHIGSFHLNGLNSPGLLMFFIWVLCQFLCIFYFKDLPKEKPSSRALTAVASAVPLTPAKDDSDTPQCSEYASYGVIALLLVQFLNMFNQTAYETWLTPFTLETFGWKQTSNSLSYIATAVVAISTYIAMTRAQYGLVTRGRWEGEGAGKGCGPKGPW
jgi:ceroid-lipofuscinosis MFS transporter 7